MSESFSNKDSIQKLWKTWENSMKAAETHQKQTDAKLKLIVGAVKGVGLRLERIEKTLNSKKLS